MYNCPRCGEELKVVAVDPTGCDIWGCVSCLWEDGDEY